VLVNCGKKENMRSSTIICIRWKLTGRLEHFVNLGKVFTYYDSDELGVSRSKLNRRNLFEGFHNDTIEIVKTYVR
jgi:hypothetical protein